MIRLSINLYRALTNTPHLSDADTFTVFRTLRKLSEMRRFYILYGIATVPCIPIAFTLPNIAPISKPITLYRYIVLKKFHLTP